MTIHLLSLKRIKMVYDDLNNLYMFYQMHEEQSKYLLQ